MTSIQLEGIAIAGVSASVPQQISTNLSAEKDEQVDRLVSTTGIENKRVARPGITTSDLCADAAENLLDTTSISKEAIAILVFVTQTPDYILPSTAHVLQDRLGLSQSTICIQVNEGCSGYVYGLYIAGQMLQSLPQGKYGLLLVGDTSSKLCSPTDRSTAPLFGDAGTATLLHNTGKNADHIQLSLGGDGSGYKDIIVPGGSGRATYQEVDASAYDEQGRSALDLHLDGMNVFTFGITKVAKVVKEHATNFNVDLPQLDIALFHQANRMMNEKIRKKLKLTEHQVPYTLKFFGNTSSSTIPLTLVAGEPIQYSDSEDNAVLMCGFGVGLSWGIATLNLSGDMPRLFREFKDSI